MWNLPERTREANKRTDRTSYESGPRGLGPWEGGSTVKNHVSAQRVPWFDPVSLNEHWRLSTQNGSESMPNGSETLGYTDFYSTNAILTQSDSLLLIIKLPHIIPPVFKSLTSLNNFSRIFCIQNPQIEYNRTHLFQSQLLKGQPDAFPDAKYPSR